MLLKIILVLVSAGLMFGQCGKTVPNPKTGAPDCVGTATGTGDALTTNPLSQFAATTSAQFAGVITNETGTGLVVLGTGPTITLPNATGLPDGGLTLTDVTTNNSSTSNHGFLKKLDNSAAHFMDGQGNWSTPAGGTAGAPLFVQTASSSAVTAASETTLIGAGAGSLTIPAAWFTSAGTVLDACASGLITTGAVPGTVRFKLKFGSTVVADTGAVTPLVSVTNGVYETCLRLTARTVGASGTIMVANILPMTGATLTPGEIVFANPTPGTAIVVDTTATQVVGFTVTWGTGATNSITGLTFVLVGPGSAVSSVQGATGAVTITDVNLSTGDVTTNNVSTSKHGFVPKAPNDATMYLNGTGAYSVPAGGSSIFSSFSGQTGNVAMTGSDVVVYTVNNVPALAAGGCYRFELAVLNESSAASTKIKIDGTTVATPWGAATSAYLVASVLLYCNITAQSNQQLSSFPNYYHVTNNTGSPVFAFPGDGYTSTPTAVDWSTTHTVTLTVNQAAGNIQGAYFSVSQK